MNDDPEPSGSEGDDIPIPEILRLEVRELFQGRQMALTKLVTGKGKHRP